MRRRFVQKQATSVVGPSICRDFSQNPRAEFTGSSSNDEYPVRRRGRSVPERDAGHRGDEAPEWPRANHGWWRRHRAAHARHTSPPMAILVDELREYPGVDLPFTSWCHMATDGRFEELHDFAARLGLRRAWFQGDHYDLPPHGRARAVALGAEEVATEQLLARMTGPRGDRARRRVLVPRGRARLVGDDGPRVLRYPAGALVVIGGPAGAGGSTLAARAVDGARVPVLHADLIRAGREG